MFSQAPVPFVYVHLVLCAVGEGVDLAVPVVDVIVVTACRGLADTAGGTFDSRGIRDIACLAGRAVCAAVCVGVGFAGFAILMIAGIAGFERACLVGALACTVGVRACASVRAAVGCGIGFAGTVIDVVVRVAAGEFACGIFAERGTVCIGAAFAV